MNLPSLNEITEKGQKAFKRFPVTLIWAIVGSLYFIIIINNSSNSFDEHANLFITLILGLSWLIGIQFFIEQLADSKKWLWLKLVVLAFLFLFYWHLPEAQKLDDNPEYLTRFFLYFIGGHLFVLFAPFTRKWDRSAYWNYVMTVGASIGRSLLFSGVLYLGLTLALVAIDALFDVKIQGKRYGQLFIFCLGIVNTWIYLADFPKNIQENTTLYINKALEVFVKYILIPLVLLYMIILYAYSFKIIFQWQLPKGWVSYLVTALALLGFLVQVIINPIQKNVKSWTINQFYPWFYRFLLPLTTLLFVAIFRRISDYGITEKRYFVLAIALWILGIVLYILFSKSKRLIVLPSSLLIITLASSFGFWGAFHVSENSQVRQFKKVFTNVISNHKIATNRQYVQLRSIIDYLDDKQSISKLGSITGIDMEATFKKDKWLNTTKVLDSLGITIDPNEKNNSLYSNYYSYYKNINNNISYDISSYQYMTEIALPNYKVKRTQLGVHELSINSKNESLSILSTKDSSTIMDIPIKEKLKALTKYGKDLQKAKEKDLTIISKNDSIAVKLIFTQLGFYMKKDSISISNSRAFLFLKKY